MREAESSGNWDPPGREGIVLPSVFGPNLVRTEIHMEGNCALQCVGPGWVTKCRTGNCLGPKKWVCEQIVFRCATDIN